MGLEITKGELRRLIGFKPEQVFRSSMMAREEQIAFLRNQMVFSLVLTLIIVGVIYVFIVVPTIGSSIILGAILLIIVLSVVVAGRWLWWRLTSPKILSMLLDEVDKYHAVIKATDINDQRATDENDESIINDRQKVIAALQLVREDLVQALKTERLLRDNRKLLANNQQDLFASNVETLGAMSLQPSSQTTEYAQIENQLLQIAVNVQAQIRKLRKV
jgi:membrane glycosyltransferase